MKNKSSHVVFEIPPVFAFITKGEEEKFLSIYGALPLNGAV
jgi:hypothetical protein